jgi:hypothetical protein
MWFDIRCASRQQQSVAGIQKGWQIQLGPQSGYEHRHGLRTDGDGFDIFLADHVEVRLPMEPAVGWNSDERQARHVEYIKRPAKRLGFLNDRITPHRGCLVPLSRTELAKN